MALCGSIFLNSAVAFAADGDVGCVNDLCGVGAHDGGSGGGTQGGNGAPGGGSSSGVTCTYTKLSEPLDPSSKYWEGHTAADGDVMMRTCSGGVTATNAGLVFVPNAGPAAPPPPDPADLAQQAFQQFNLTHPTLHFGPDEALVAVKVPVWLWVDPMQLAPVTVTAGGVSVTATPTLKSVTWSMGEPANPNRPRVMSKSVTCTGSSMFAAAPASVAPSVKPPCGYTFQWRSLKERTAGTGTWAVTASANWVVNWTSNTGEGGQIVAQPVNSVHQLEVGEWQTVGVYMGDK